MHSPLSYSNFAPSANWRQNNFRWSPSVIIETRRSIFHSSNEIFFCLFFDFVSVKWIYFVKLAVIAGARLSIFTPLMKFSIVYFSISWVWNVKYLDFVVGLCWVPISFDEFFRRSVCKFRNKLLLFLYLY